MAFRKPQKEALYLDAVANIEQRSKPPRAEVAQAFHQNVRLVKGLALRNFVEQFKDGSLRR